MPFALTSLSHFSRVDAVLARLGQRFGALAGLVGSALNAAPQLVARPASSLPVAKAPASIAARLTVVDQWSKLSSILNASIGGAVAAHDMQSAATRQLDLAQYGLTTLVDELSAVMSIPGRRSRSATLHQLGSGFDMAAEANLAQQTGGQALAA
ncbi:MAG: hypothetical protein ABL897_14410 [Hyphomicrobium sp.]